MAPSKRFRAEVATPTVLLASGPLAKRTLDTSRPVPTVPSEEAHSAFETPSIPGAVCPVATPSLSGGSGLGVSDLHVTPETETLTAKGDTPELGVGTAGVSPETQGTVAMCPVADADTPSSCASGLSSLSGVPTLTRTLSAITPTVPHTLRPTDGAPVPCESDSGVGISDMQEEGAPNSDVETSADDTPGTDSALSHYSRVTSLLTSLSIDMDLPQDITQGERHHITDSLVLKLGADLKAANADRKMAERQVAEYASKAFAQSARCAMYEDLMSKLCVEVVTLAHKRAEAQRQIQTIQRETEREREEETARAAQALRDLEEAAELRLQTCLAEQEAESARREAEIRDEVEREKGYLAFKQMEEEDARAAERERERQVALAREKETLAALHEEREREREEWKDAAFQSGNRLSMVLADIEGHKVRGAGVLLQLSFFKCEKERVETELAEHKEKSRKALKKQQKQWKKQLDLMTAAFIPGSPE
ncbi:hypothetical protein KIPB_002781 [Kipferlia bialata]|uniref:Uncharacterized protein n=1 Tax=Kipferlia bialata TaxID=797122 RepID=A0A9K3CR89_9EUKA|nr:hypothetical protein KIPB_002781 [Kipferlia bialata]|eukprot:g2781.t1